MYSLELLKSSKKFLEKIPDQDSGIILKKLNSIRENPFRFLKRLKNSNLWGLKVIKSRAEVDILVSGKKIIVLRIGYRKNVYNTIRPKTLNTGFSPKVYRF